jgi:HEPN domain-containing protein
MDESIIELIRCLREKGRNDLAGLIIRSASHIEDTTQYGSYWNKYLSVFSICAPLDQYRQLQELNENDRDFILGCVKHIFPKSEDLEVGSLDFKILQDEKKIKENESLAGSWIERSNNRLQEGRSLTAKGTYAEAVSSFQECIELSIKAIFLLLTDSYPKSHEFKDKEFKDILDKIPKVLAHLEFHKLYLYSKFWSNFYTIAKYGLENFSVGAEKLFGPEEAELAKLHSEKCYLAAHQLREYLDHPW